MKNMKNMKNTNMNIRMEKKKEKGKDKDWHKHQWMKDDERVSGPSRKMREI